MGAVCGGLAAGEDRAVHPRRGVAVSAHGSELCGFGRGRRSIGADKFGPDAMPVVWTKVPAPDLAVRGAFDGGAPFDGDGLQPTRPLRHHDRVNTESPSERHSGATLGLGEIGSDLHSRDISPWLQEMLAPGQFHCLAFGYAMGAVETIEDIRHANLLQLIEEMGGIQPLAVAIARSHSQVSQLKIRAKHSTTGKQRNIGSPLARWIEAQVGKPVGWMDQRHAGRAETQLSDAQLDALALRLRGRLGDGAPAAAPLVETKDYHGPDRRWHIEPVERDRRWQGEIRSGGDTAVNRSFGDRRKPAPAKRKTGRN